MELELLECLAVIISYMNDAKVIPAVVLDAILHEGAQARECALSGHSLVVLWVSTSRASCSTRGFRKIVSDRNYDSDDAMRV